MLCSKGGKRREKKIRRRCAREAKRRYGVVVMVKESRLLRPFVRLVPSLLGRTGCREFEVGVFTSRTDTFAQPSLKPFVRWVDR